MDKLIHGGDLVGYRRRYGREPLDFSSNCNPLGLPPGVAAAATQALAESHRYPDPLCRELTEALAQAEGVAADQIVCGNGAADLIFRLVLALGPRHALVLAPTFAEYRQALDTVGCQTQDFPLEAGEGYQVTERLLEAIRPGLDMLLLCNPNNPTGLAVRGELLEAIVHRCRQVGTVLVADECFGCFLDQPETATVLPWLGEGVVILKAFTKLYAMAGLRLGYCLCEAELATRLRGCGQPWAVSNVAQAAGIQALAEQAYVAESRGLIARERAFLGRGLEALGFAVTPGQANYLLLRAPIPDLGRRLAEEGILVRSCANYRGLGEDHYRVAVRTHEENTCLLKALEAISQAQKER